MHKPDTNVISSTAKRAGEQTEELFINNPDHPLKATEQGNQTHEVDFVEGQDHKPHQNLAERIPDDINTQER